MKKAELDELARLEARATPGPWEIDNEDRAIIAAALPPPYRVLSGAAYEYIDNDNDEADRAFVVALRNATRELIIAARRAREEATP